MGDRGGGGERKEGCVNERIINVHVHVYTQH